MPMNEKASNFRKEINRNAFKEQQIEDLDTTTRTEGIEEFSGRMKMSELSKEQLDDLRQPTTEER